MAGDTDAESSAKGLLVSINERPLDEVRFNRQIADGGFSARARACSAVQADIGRPTECPTSAAKDGRPPAIAEQKIGSNPGKTTKPASQSLDFFFMVPAAIII